MHSNVVRPLKQISCYGRGPRLTWRFLSCKNFAIAVRKSDEIVFRYADLMKRFEQIFNYSFDRCWKCQEARERRSLASFGHTSNVKYQRKTNIIWCTLSYCLGWKGERGNAYLFSFHTTCNAATSRPSFGNVRTMFPWTVPHKPCNIWIKIPKLISSQTVQTHEQKQYILYAFIMIPVVNLNVKNILWAFN